MRSFPAVFADGAELFRASLSKRGLAKTFILVPRFAWRKGRTCVSEVRFDRAYGVHTRGVVKPPGRGPRFEGSLPYQPVSPQPFRRLIDSLAIRYNDFTFVDVGCGKGRALILATEYPFRRIIGIELSAALANTARKNIAAFAPRVPEPPKADVVTADAASYNFPPEPSVVFFFNPFGEETMKVVLQNLELSLREDPRELLFVYMKPTLRRVIDDVPFLAPVDATPDHAVWRAVLPEEELAQGQRGPGEIVGGDDRTQATECTA